MTDRELRRLGKTKLLTIVRDQEAELDEMKIELARLREALDDRAIRMENCGSLAEASLQVNEVFQAAQAAADSYLRGVREQETAIVDKIRRMEAEADETVETRLRNTDALCRRMTDESKSRAQAYWTELQKQLDRYVDSHNGLLSLLRANGIRITIPDMPESQNPLSAGALSPPPPPPYRPGAAQEKERCEYGNPDPTHPGTAEPGTVAQKA